MSRPKNCKRCHRIKCICGRPPIVDDVVIQKLEQAFSLGCSDLEACFYANIGKSTLYNYQKKNPDFLERKEQLKSKPVLMARKSVLKHIEDDGKLAMDFLKNKKSDEFNTKVESEISGAGGQPLEISINVIRKNDKNPV